MLWSRRGCFLSRMDWSARTVDAVARGFVLKGRLDRESNLHPRHQPRAMGPVPGRAQQAIADGVLSPHACVFLAGSGGFSPGGADGPGDLGNVY